MMPIYIKNKPSRMNQNNTPEYTIIGAVCPLCRHVELGVMTSVLDATAGNRCMWKIKSHPGITFMDQEPDLEIKPDIIGDNTNTDFEDEQVHTIFYDPPHGFGATNTMYMNKNRKMAYDYWMKYDKPEYANKMPGYYGLEIYKTKKELLNNIAAAQREFYRILSQFGCLWVKWNDMKIPVSEIEALFINWSLMQKIWVKSPSGGNQPNKSQTFWLLYMKNHSEPKQSIIKQSKRTQDSTTKRIS